MAVNTYSLVTLDEVKNLLNMLESSVSSDDDLLENLINRVSILFESYTDREILTREHTEYMDGKGAYVLFPRQTPITTVSGIWEDSDWTWGDDTLIDATTYRVVDYNYVVFNTAYLTDYLQNVKIIYTAGYTSTPDDLKQACITEVARIYRHRDQVDTDSKNMSGGSVTYTDKQFLPLTLTVLNRYRRVTVI